MEFITGEKFVSLSDQIFSINDVNDYYKYKNTLDLNKNPNVIYTHVHYIKYLFETLENCEKELIIISHNSDNNTPDIKIPKCVKKWYSQNVTIKNDKIESIPIGLENNMWFPHINKKQKMIDKISKQKNYRKLLYINHNVNTNKKERIEPYQIFSNNQWCSIINGQNGFNFESYIDNIYNHKFVLCPDGNGIDTHRLWETIYLKSIPIVKRSINTNFYNDLPICYVDNWKEINEQFLNNEYNRINSCNFNLEKLDMNYWKNKILQDVR